MLTLCSHAGTVCPHTLVSLQAEDVITGWRAERRAEAALCGSMSACRWHSVREEADMTVDVFFSPGSPGCLLLRWTADAQKRNGLCNGKDLSLMDVLAYTEHITRTTRTPLLHCLLPFCVCTGTCPCDVMQVSCDMTTDWQTAFGSCCYQPDVVLMIYTPSVRSRSGSEEEFCPDDSHGKRALERQSVWESLRKMGQGVVTGEDPPTFTTRAWLMRFGWHMAVGWGHYTGSPPQDVLPDPEPEQQRRGEHPNSFYDWRHRGCRLINGENAFVLIMTYGPAESKGQCEVSPVNNCCATLWGCF